MVIMRDEKFEELKDDGHRNRFTGQP
jgi:hypothetical protein